MNKIKLLLLLAMMYFIGLYTGVNIQDVDAIVKAPGEYNQPMASQNKQQKPLTSQNAPAQMPPQAPAIQNPVIERIDNKGTVIENSTVIEEPVARPAAVDRGATLYSISSAMQVDIQRLEDDVASLKNKVNILSNMR